MKTTPRLARIAPDVAGDSERWFARLRAHDLSEAERAEHAKWLRASEDNRRAFEECQRVWGLADALANDPEVLGFAAGTASNQTEIRRRWPGSLRRFAVPLALAASIVATVLVIRPDLVGIGPVHYATAVGEQRRVVLDDGSAMHVNTDTAVEVAYSESARLVKLLRGEATFSVQHDAARPFVVHAGNGSVRAVGTKFNVNSTPERVTVAVLEGAVIVSRDEHEKNPSQATRPVAAGEEVIYSTTKTAALPVAVRATELRRVEAWQKGRLEFEAMPLESAIQEINRYLSRKIVLADTALVSIRITGTFRVGDTDSVLFALRETLGISADFDDERILLNAPANDDPSMSM